MARQVGSVIAANDSIHVDHRNKLKNILFAELIAFLAHQSFKQTLLRSKDLVKYMHDPGTVAFAGMDPSRKYVTLSIFHGDVQILEIRNGKYRNRQF